MRTTRSEPDGPPHAGAIRPSATAAPGLRIGELARLVGVTTRAIRHYHEVGLMAEPVRDRSGYRRYGAGDVVVLARIRRLRELGMPIEQIADRLSASGTGSPGEAEPSAALAELADDLTRQIEELTALRARVRALASSPAADQPATTWAAALVRAGLLGDADTLPGPEREAIDLLDALAPESISDLIQQANTLSSSPAARRRLSKTLQRFRALAPDAPASRTDELAAEFAAVLNDAGLAERGRATDGSATPAPVPLDVMGKLLGDRFSPAQLRCLWRFRELTGADVR